MRARQRRLRNIVGFACTNPFAAPPLCADRDECGFDNGRCTQTETFIDVSCGEADTCALTSAGAVVCSGGAYMGPPPSAGTFS